jgi:glycosyltransferase involved in cell wall biosynthesis
MAGRSQSPTQADECELSVVVPVYGCGDCLVALHDRLTHSLATITDRYELVFVDDRSLDDGWSVLQRLARSDGRVRAVRLSRNFGQDAAITAGLSEARGSWVVVMDCDLQEAPEDIPRLWTAAQDGYDVVRTIRRGRRHAPLKRWGSRLYRRLTFETDTRADYSTLSLISRRVVDAYLSLQDQDREYMIALDWLGFSATAIEIAHARRHAGKSTYTLGRLFRVALNGMFFRSTLMLRLVILAGFVIALIGLGIAAFEIADYFAGPNQTVPGYTSLAVLVLVVGGVIIISVGVVGLYVGRIFQQVKNRPLFVIDSRAEGPDLSGSVVTGDQAQIPSRDPR